MHKMINVYFFQSDSGKEPVRAWLQNLPLEDKKIIGKDIRLVEYKWPVGMPLCRKLTKELFEIRSNITSSKIARIIFCIKEKKMILLHGFIKKTQKTPKKEIELAHNRMKGLDI